MKFFFLFLSLFVSAIGQSQNFSITSQKVIGGANYDALTPYKSPDGNGYFFIGESSSNISGDKTENSFGLKDIWVVKTDNNFAILWDKTYGGSLEENFSDAIFVNNNLLIVSNSNSPVSGNKTIDANNNTFDVWMIEISQSDGSIVEEHLLGGNGGEIDVKVAQKNNEEIYLTFSSNSANSGSIGINNIGSIDTYVCEYSLPSKTTTKETYIGITDSDRAHSILFIDDKIILGITSVGGNSSLPVASYGATDTYLSIIDTNLTILSTKNFGGSLNDYLSTLLEKDGFIYAIGSSNSPISGNKETECQGNTIGFWMVKMDTELNKIWDVSYGGFGNDLLRTAYIDNNGRIVAGLTSVVLGPGGDKTTPLYGGADGWVIVLNPDDGSLISQTAFGGDMDDYLRGVLPINNSGDILVAMTSASGISGNKTIASNGGNDLWLIEVDASNYLNIPENQLDNRLTLFPNPTNGIINIQAEQELKKVDILNANGRKILSTTKKQVDVSHFPSGLYFVQGTLEDGSVVRKKFVKE